NSLEGCRRSEAVWRGKAEGRLKVIRIPSLRRIPRKEERKCLPVSGLGIMQHTLGSGTAREIVPYELRPWFLHGAISLSLPAPDGAAGDLPGRRPSSPRRRARREFRHRDRGGPW